MFGEFPYKTTRKDMDLMKEMICSGKWKPSYKARAGLPQPSGLACELVAALMNRDPASRVTAAEALQYDFLTACLPKKPSKSSVPDEIEFVIPPVVQMQNPRASPNESHSFAWSPSFHPTLLHARSTVLEYEECTPVHRKQTVEEALAALQQQQGKQWQRTGTRCMSEPFLRVHTVDSELQRLPARLCTHSGLSGLSMSTVGEDKANDDFSLPGTPSTTEGPRLSTSTTGDSDSQLHSKLRRIVCKLDSAAAWVLFLTPQPYALLVAECQLSYQMEFAASPGIALLSWEIPMRTIC